MRDDDLAMNSSMTESETGLSDVNTIPGKTPPKVNWNCDNSITAGNLLLIKSVRSESELKRES